MQKTDKTLMGRIIRFLSRNAREYFTTSQIAAQLGANKESVGSTLSVLLGRGKVFPGDPVPGQRGHQCATYGHTPHVKYIPKQANKSPLEMYWPAPICLQTEEPLA